MKLSEALKIKKDIVETLKATQRTIIKLSFSKTTKNSLDINTLIEKQSELREILVSLKLSIREANSEITEYIFKLSELKEEKKCYEKILDGMNNSNVDTPFTKVEITDKIKNISEEIEKINGYLKEFNDSTEIDIDLSKYLGTKITKKS
ncbi:MAG TPA: hypothetical protein VJ881_03410 [Halanaerobiales bacterium]|nr:hypothetical protein [Halanaerobiales bacterium]